MKNWSPYLKGCHVVYQDTPESHDRKKDVGEMLIVENKCRKKNSEGMGRLLMPRIPIPTYYLVVFLLFGLLCPLNWYGLFVYWTLHFPERNINLKLNKSKSHIVLLLGHSCKKWYSKNISSSVNLLPLYLLFFELLFPIAMLYFLT